MELLVCVINQEEKVEDVLSRFLELGITGATLIRSEGMGKVLQDVPVFAGLQSLLSRARPQNTTLFSVIESAEKRDAAIDAVQQACGGLDAPATGILFTVSIDRVVGLADELDTGGPK